MNTFTLIRRGLIHHAASHAAVAVGVAVATATIIAALLLGSSTNATLREIALQRLGRCTHLLAPRHPLPALRALAFSAGAPLAVPLLACVGSIRNGDEGLCIPQVEILGCEPSFWELYPNVAHPELGGRRIALSETLAQELGAKPGDEVLVTVTRARHAPAGTLFAQRKRNQLTATLRLEVAGILPMRSAGDFSPWPTSSRQPGSQRLVVCDRTWLALQTGYGDVVSHVAWTLAPGARPPPLPRLRPEDVGLRLIADDATGLVRVESADLLLTKEQEDAVRVAAKKIGVPCAAASIYLADRIRCGTRESSYALIAGLEALQPFTSSDGLALNGAPALGEAWLNLWLAEDLAAVVGQELFLDFPLPAEDGTYPLTSRRLPCSRVVAMQGPARDRTLVPAINGVTEAEDLAHWEAPFPIDLARVSARDDAYWAAYRTTPKLFVAPEMLRELWNMAGGHGLWITSLRLASPQGMTAHALARRLETVLAEDLSPDAAGLVARPVRAEALSAAQGSTDLAQLFLGLGGILILAAAALAALLVRLHLAGRATEIGVLRACGLSTSQVRLIISGECLAVTACGVAVGTVAGLALAAGLLHLLGTAWSAAVGGIIPTLHGDITALLIGSAAGAGIGLIALLTGLRGWNQCDAATLILAGKALTTRQPSISPRRAGWIAGVALAWALALTGLALSDTLSWPIACLGSGLALLVAGFAALWFGAALALRTAGSPPTMGRLIFRGIVVNPLRSLAVMVVMAAAAFLLVTVAAQRREAASSAVATGTGTGGYALQLDTSLPLGVDPGTPAGRKRLGFSAQEEELFQGSVLMPLLVSPGDDVSCRDPAKPLRPRLIGVGAAFMQRGGFPLFTKNHLHWQALDATEGADSVPVFGDADSVRWILHAGLGDLRRFPLAGQEVQLRIAGLLPGSIFAGELLMNEKYFRSLFPRIDTPGRFLLACPAERENALSDIVRRRLGPLGVTVTSTRSVLNSVLAVQNTYLSIFLALGGLGLVLAALGLTALLARTAVERRWEWALLAVCGLGRGQRALLLALEHLVLVACGLIAGTLAALIATLPTLLAPGAVVAWGSVAAVLFAVLTASTLAATLTAWISTDATPAQDLRRG